tara:strand:- start:81 stop:581 length:501 start_codon:yes stop_codon:yes gene_type:complete
MTVLNTDSTKKWYVINYQLTNEPRLIENLSNQNFDFYIPKILLLKNKIIKNTPLFPGYGFVQSAANQINSLNYTKGLKYVLKNGAEYSYICDSILSEIQEANKDFQTQPLAVMPKLHSDVIILKGPMKGNLVRVMGFSKSDRVKVLFNLLGRNVHFETTLANLNIT